MKKLFAWLLVLALAVGMTSAVAEEGDLLSKIRERGTVIIAMEGVWSPWTYHDETTGELTGLEVEIGNIIAEGLGVKADFQETAWDAILAGVDSGRFDIACNGVGLTEARAEKYSFTDPYIYSHKALVVRDDNEDIKTVDDLAGKKTANSPGSTYADLAAGYGAEVTYIDTLGETIAMVERGSVDATLNSQESIVDYLKQHPDAKIKIVQVLPGDKVAYPVRKVAETESFVAAVNEILAAAREDGRLAAISEKYLGVDLTREAE